MSEPSPKPWYRHAWPWLLIVPPAGAVVGGAVTLYLAISRPDPLVRKDCIKDGVTIVCGEEARKVLEAAKGKDSTPPPP
jgi:hypothetical protein